MTWVKLDDGFMRHRKIRSLSHKALALHISGLCHCAAQLTDGRIERDDVPMLLAEAKVTKAALTELVAVGIWLDLGDHFLIHDYLEYQEPRAKVLQRREKWAKKKKSQRESWGESPGDRTGDSWGESQAPDPTRPVNVYPLKIVTRVPTRIEESA